MKTNQEILDNLGKLVVDNIYDDVIKYFRELKDNNTKWGTGTEYTDVFNKLNEEDKETLAKYVKDTVRTTIFGVLGIFEEHPEFKFIYEENGQQVDLTKISEMLKAELIIENGWIERFSKFRQE
jgi:hypothetical protein